MSIREINSDSDTEINWVAQNMRQTLVEVLGEEKGGSLYTMQWLVDRVRWHLDPKNTEGKVFLYTDENENILGHAIARIDYGSSFGYFSTIFVDSDFRRNGIATQLMRHVENWFKVRTMPKIVYNTAENHVALIGLFQSHGYEITHREAEMVQLTKKLA